MGVGEQLEGALEAVAPTLREPAVSFVVPGLSEAENLPLLAAQIKAALPDTPYEMIFVDDGSTDNGRQVISDLQAADPAVSGVRRACQRDR